MTARATLQPWDRSGACGVHASIQKGTARPVVLPIRPAPTGFCNSTHNGPPHLSSSRHQDSYPPGNPCVYANPLSPLHGSTSPSHIAQDENLPPPRTERAPTRSDHGADSTQRPSADGDDSPRNSHGYGPTAQPRTEYLLTAPLPTDGEGGNGHADPPRRRALSVDAVRAPSQRSTTPPPEPGPIRALDFEFPNNREWFLRSPDGDRRPGLPRADTPRPRGRSASASPPPRPRSPTPATAVGDKRDLALRSPASGRGTMTRKRAKTSPHPRRPQAEADDLFAPTRGRNDTARGAGDGEDRAAARPPQARFTPVSPANIPLPPSDDTAASSDYNSMYAPTECDEEEDGREPDQATSASVRTRRTAAPGAGVGPSGPEAKETGLPGLVLAPGSLAAQVATTDDVLPSAKDAFVYAPIPAEGPPHVNPASPRWLFQNLDVPQIVLWENIAGGKLFATLFGAGGADHLIDSALFAKVASIRTELIRLTGNASLKVTPPDPASRPTALNAPPYGFLVHGIDDDTAQRLLAMGFLSTPKVTVLFFPFAVTYPTLMVNFMFISDKTNEEVRRMVVALLRRPDNRARILDLVAISPGAGSTRSRNARARDIIKSAHVDSTPRSGRGGTPTPVFNLYVDTRASSIDEWKKWKAFFTTLHWHDAEFGTLGLHDDVYCPGCRGADHYRWACPFMGLSEWKGTMPKQSWKTTGPEPKTAQRAAQAGKRRGGRDARQ